MHIAYDTAPDEDVLDRALHRVLAIIAVFGSKKVMARCPQISPFALVTLKESTHQMWVLQLIHHSDIIQLDIQVLIHALQCAPNRDIILKLDGDFVVDQRFEEAEEQHDGLRLKYVLSRRCWHRSCFVVMSCW